MRIVFATDLSIEALAGANLSVAVADADDEEDVEIDMLHVVESRTFGERQLFGDDLDVAQAEKLLRRWLNEHAGIDREFNVVVREGDPTEAIEAYVAETGADLLVLGQTGKGRFSRMILGSTAHKVAQDPPCRLMFAHREFSAFGHPRRIGVGVDFDETSNRAVREAADLARRLDAGVDVVHVFDPPRTPAFPGGLIGYDVTDDDIDELEQEAERQMEEFVDDHREILTGLEAKGVVLSGSPTHQLVEYTITNGIDVLCLGTVGHSGIDRRLLGSVSGGVVRHMPANMMLVPPVDRTG